MNEEFTQCIFDFVYGNQDGYENFLQELAANRQRIKDIWHLPIGKNVRLTLTDIPGSIEGRLEVAKQPKKLNRSEPLQLKIGRTGFWHYEIESCAVIE